MNKQVVYMLLGFLSVAVTVQGQTQEEIEKLRKQYEGAIRRGTLPTETEEGIEVPSEAVSEAKVEILRAKTGEPRAEKEIIYFGYDFFTAREVVPIFENLPVPANYRLGPGDEIVISLWGETQLRNTYTIDREGKVYINLVGQLLLTGKTFSEAEVYLKKQFERAYSTLKGSNPTTYMDVSLGALKSINVQFVGEVNVPGIHTIHPFSTVTTGLIQAGGVKTTGSLRDIQIIRDGKEISHIDLYSLLLEGQSVENFKLQEQNILFIPIRKSTITVNGEVHKPAIYEALPNESLRAILAYAGGLKANASTRMEILRIIPASERNSDDYAFYSIYLDLDELSQQPARDGDIVTIREILEVDNKVTISGQVKEPGTYPLVDNMTLFDLLTIVGGINDPDYLKSMYLGKVDVIRRDRNSEYSQIIELNLGKVVNEEGHSFLLENHDRVVVYQNPTYKATAMVQVSGEVLFPGTYSIQKDFETLGSVFERAGGFTPRAFKEGIEVHRGDTRLVIESFDNTVVDGDSIFVPVTPDIVSVMGAVYNPGLIAFKPRRSLEDYIRLAGGYTPDANPRDVIVIYADGSVVSRRRFFDPKLRAGAIVQVNLEEEKEPFNTTEFLKETASITASLATIFFIIQSTK